MALMPTKEWSEIRAILLDARLIDDESAHRRNVMRRLIEKLEDQRFPYDVYPDANDGVLSVYPRSVYDFDMLFERSMSFETRFLKSSTRLLTHVQVSHVIGNDRFQTYETR